MKRGIVVLVLVVLATLLVRNLRRGDDGPQGSVALRAVVWKPNNAKAWDDALTLFAKAHPKILVKRELGPNDSGNFHDLLTQKLRNKEKSLDVFLMDVVWPAEFANAGWALPLDADLDTATREAFFPGCLQSATVDGKVVGLPFFTDAGLLYYRKDLLAKHKLQPPATWRELRQQCKQIRAAQGDANLHGYSGQFKQYEGLVCNMLEFVHSNGGDLMRLNEKAAEDAVTFVAHELIHNAAPRGVLAYQEQESLDLFKEGGAIFHRNWPYAWSICNDPAQSKVVGKVGMARLPCFPGGKSASALGGWIWGVHALSEHPAEARTFIKFMTSPAVQKIFAVQVGKAPTRRALYSDVEVLEAHPHFADMLPVFEAATPRPRTAIYPEISHILQRALHTCLTHPKHNLGEVLRAAQKEIDAAQARVQ